MSPLVLDASVALAWLLGEEGRSGAEEALARLRDGDAMVPLLWHLEVRNGLLVAMRRGRIGAGGPQERLGALGDLPIRTDRHPDLETAFALAERHALSFCDAVYLELAGRHAAPLATLDNALARAAEAEGLTLVCAPGGG